MPIIDIIIAVALLVSIAVGLMRGLVKEGISIAALLAAIWAALYFGPVVGDVSSSWLSSEGLQMWFGRILVFAIVLSIGGLLGWGISKLVHMSVLSGMDRFLGALFGVARGILLLALFTIGGQFAGFDKDEWWQQSRTIPHVEVVADWIKVMAPKGLELLTPDEQAETLPVDIPEKLLNPGVT
jgi:membrane protein required for colicin V production